MLEENNMDLKELMEEEGVTDEEVFLDSLNERDNLLGFGEGGFLPTIDYYKEYLTIKGYGCGLINLDTIQDMIWTLYPRKDGDFVVFQCLKGVVPFGFGAKDVTLALNACFELEGCGGECGCDSDFNLFPSKRVEFVGSAGGGDGCRGVGDDDGWGGGEEDEDEEDEEDEDEEDEEDEEDDEYESKACAVGNDGNATLEGNGVSITCQVKRNVCQTYNLPISDISVPTIKIPLRQFYSLCIKGLRAKRTKAAQQEHWERKQLEARKAKWDTIALPMLAPYIKAFTHPHTPHLTFRCATATHANQAHNLSWLKIQQHLQDDHWDDCVSGTNPLPSLLFVSDPALDVEIPVPHPEDLHTLLTTFAHPAEGKEAEEEEGPKKARRDQRPVIELAKTRRRVREDTSEASLGACNPGGPVRKR
ncbi:hypothetical protein HK104_006451 [Borealophlyctis nickersoniae]|nr:hypothetical protein HK104_006451 [Borealophlyctis nickersoniae]